MKENEFNRRDFLKTAASVAVLELTRPLNIPLYAYETPTRRLEKQFGINLPAIDNPVLVRIIDRNHPITNDFVLKEVEPNLRYIKNHPNFQQNPLPLTNPLHEVHGACLDDLTALINRCWFVWGDLYINSAYRSESLQKQVISKNNKDFRYVEGINSSHHRGGLAIDFTTYGIKFQVGSFTGFGKTKPGFETTKQGFWVSNEAWKYGFVQSYEGGNNHDGITDEPWHYLYIGKPLAETYHNLKLKGWKGDVFELQSYYPQLKY